MKQFLAALVLVSAVVAVGYVLPAPYLPPTANDSFHTTLRKDRASESVPPPGREEDYQQVLNAVAKSKGIFDERVRRIQFQSDSEAMVTFSWSKHSGTATLSRRSGHWVVVSKVYHA
jgi:hypothetical protein